MNWLLKKAWPLVLMLVMTPTLALAASPDVFIVDSANAGLWGLQLFGWIFWALVAVEFISLVIAMENESGIGATICLLAFGLIIQFVYKFDIFGWILSNPWKVAGVVAGYLLLGVFWSIFRWYMFYSERIQKLIDGEPADSYYAGEKQQALMPEKTKGGYSDRYERQTREKFLGDPQNGALEDDRKAAWNAYIDEQSPKLKENATRVTNWIAFWLPDAFAYALSDMIYGICKRIYYRMANVYESVARNIRDRAKV